MLIFVKYFNLINSFSGSVAITQAKEGITFQQRGHSTAKKGDIALQFLTFGCELCTGWRCRQAEVFVSVFCVIYCESFMHCMQ